MALSTIGTNAITDGTIATGDIADDAVTNTKLDLSETYNFTAMPQKSGTDIVSKGSNSNGAYVKFGDGTLICTAQKTTLEQNNGASAGNFYYSDSNTWTYPLAFDAAPRVICQVVGGHYNAISAKAVSVGTSSTTYITQSINNTTNDQGMELMAIGTWG